MHETFIWLHLWVFLIRVNTIAFGQHAPPNNLSYALATNTCNAEVHLKWTEPISLLEIKNYVIIYWTKHYLTNVTIKGETTILTGDNRTTKNIKISGSPVVVYINVSGNFTDSNSTYKVGPSSNTVTIPILALNCGSTKVNDSNDANGTLYAVKLSAVIVSALIGLLIIFFLIIRGYAWIMERRYDQKDLARYEKRDNFLMPIGHELPISVDNFFDHVSSLKFNHNRGFNNEWAKLSVSIDQTCSFGNRSINVMKNRNVNVPTFDSTRVILEDTNDNPGSTYINANFVSDIEQPKAYIATQAPLPETISDFWKMIWENDVSCIVMIANLKEKDGSACCKYWPDEGESEFGQIIVKTIEVTKYADYLIRNFEIRHKRRKETRLVQQFHYRSWPASRIVPVHPISFLEFVKRVALFRKNEQSVVVHCSSGNGRTGVYVVVDTQLKRIEKQNNVSIFFNIDLIKHQRYQIVRNLEEYMFIHECILEHLMYLTKVDITPNDLAAYIEKRKEIDENGDSGFQKEFSDLLNDITAMHNSSNAAKLPQNMNKNRFGNILPYDHTRVKIRRGNITPSNEQDFINANYCNSRTRRGNFIITQNPLESTVFDFWCMVWENSCLAIIMLSYEEKDIVSYWPELNEVLKAGRLKIRCISFEKQETFDIRHLEISHSDHSHTRLVRQYRYKKWPKSENEATVKSFVHFVVQCNKWHVCSHGRSMIVHCRAGTSRSGIFVAMSRLIEQLNAEGVVNVFRTVQQLRQERMAAIQTQSQYELLYQAILVYYQTNYLKRHDDDDYEQIESITTSSVFNSSINL